MHYLIKFCEDDMSTETVLFWLEARSYSKLGPGIHREVAARKIFSKFFAADAPMLLTMPEHTIADMSASIKSHTGPSGATFDEAMAEVSYTLRYDVFPRFLTSPHYFKLVNLTLEERLRIDIVRACARARRPRPTMRDHARLRPTARPCHAMAAGQV